MRSHTTARDTAGRAENSASKARCRSVASAAVEAVRSRAESSFLQSLAAGVQRRGDGGIGCQQAKKKSQHRQCRPPHDGLRQRRTLGRRAEQLPPAESCEKLPRPQHRAARDLDPLRMDAGLRQLGQHSLQPLAPHEGDPAVVFAPQEGRPVVAHPRGELQSAGFTIVPWPDTVTTATPFGDRRRVVHRLLRLAAHLAAPCRDRMAVGCQRDIQHPDGAEDIRGKDSFFIYSFYVPFVPVKRTKKIEYGDILSTFFTRKVEPKVSAKAPPPESNDGSY